MTNKLLQALANTGTFLTPEFQTPEPADSWTFTPDQISIRRILGLESEEREYYLKHYLALLSGYPSLLTAFDEIGTTYNPVDFNQHNVVQIVGARFATLPNQVGKFLHYAPSRMPVTLDYDIAWHTANSCQITSRQRGAAALFACRSFTQGGQNFLRIDWTGDLPFEGCLELNQGWLSGSKISIHTEPGLMPYDSLLDNLRSSPYLHSLLESQNLAEDFHNSQSVHERVALVLTAMALSNQIVYPLPTIELIENDEPAVGLLTKLEHTAEHQPLLWLSDAAQLAGVAYAANGKTQVGLYHVADLVTRLDPNREMTIVTTGDNVNEGSSTTIASFDSRLGPSYRHYMYPYHGVYGEGNPHQRNQWFPSLGNHDVSQSNVSVDARRELAMYYYNMPGRYYSHVHGSIEIFSLNTIYNGYSAASVNEPDGSGIGSVQWQWFKAAAAASKARWKIVMLHQPPYSSVRQYPSLRWDFAEAGMNLVCSGHEHLYEVARKGWLYYITAGVGGANLDPGTLTYNPFSLHQIAGSHGIMRITPSDQELKTEFIDIYGRILHTVRVQHP